MAPLLVEDRPSFRLQLAEAKRLGVGGVSVDVWWGMVEAEAD
ncbi:family 14 glycosylhydrolase, partial [Rheinheimera baltica]